MLFFRRDIENLANETVDNAQPLNIFLARRKGLNNEIRHEMDHKM